MVRYYIDLNQEKNENLMLKKILNAGKKNLVWHRIFWKISLKLTFDYYRTFTSWLYGEGNFHSFIFSIVHFHFIVLHFHYYTWILTNFITWTPFIQCPSCQWGFWFHGSSSRNQTQYVKRSSHVAWKSRNMFKIFGQLYYGLHQRVESWK